MEIYFRICITESQFQVGNKFWLFINIVKIHIPIEIRIGVKFAK